MEFDISNNRSIYKPAHNILSPYLHPSYLHNNNNNTRERSITSTLTLTKRRRLSDSDIFTMDDSAPRSSPAQRSKSVTSSFDQSQSVLFHESENLYENEILDQEMHLSKRGVLPLPEEDTNQCAICGEFAKGNFFGASVCLPCKSFFIRWTKDGKPCIPQRCYGACEIRNQFRNRCQYCRYKQCLAVGMYRKEKPEYIQPAHDQELCKVCGDLANGIHFGVSSCEGCKKFFRRGLKEQSNYACKENNNCSLNPRSRNNCRHCRYQKCLNVGMSRDAIKMGRPRKRDSYGRIIQENEIDLALFQRGQSNSTNILSARTTDDYKRTPNAHFLKHRIMVDHKFDNLHSNQEIDSSQNRNNELPIQTDRMCFMQKSGLVFPTDENQYAVRLSILEKSHDTSTSHPSNFRTQQDGMKDTSLKESSEKNINFKCEAPSHMESYSLPHNTKRMPPNQAQDTISKDHLNIGQSFNRHYETPVQRMDSSAQMGSSPAVIKYLYIGTSLNDTLATTFKTERTLQVTRTQSDLSSENVFSCVKCPSDSEVRYISSLDNDTQLVNNELITSQNCSSPLNLRNDINKCCPSFNDGRRNHSLVDCVKSDQSSSIEAPEALDLRIVYNKSTGTQYDKNKFLGNKFNDNDFIDNSTASSVEQIHPASKGKYFESYNDKEGKLKHFTSPNLNVKHENSTTPSFILSQDQNTVVCSKTLYSPHETSMEKCRPNSFIRFNEKQNLHFPRNQYFINDVNSKYLVDVNPENGIQSSLIVKNPKLEKKVDPVQNIIDSKLSNPFSSSHQDSFKSYQTMTKICHSVSIPGSSSSDLLHEPKMSPKLLLPTRQNEEQNVSNLAVSDSRRHSMEEDDLKTDTQNTAQSFDAYSNESTLKYINEMFMVYDTIIDIVSQSPDNKFNNLTRALITSESNVLDGMSTDAYGYSLTKVSQQWKHLYTPRCKPTKEDNDKFTVAENKEICQMLQCYEKKVLFCDEDANQCAINTQLHDSWPTRGKDQEYWLQLQERIARQTYAETQFVHSVADIFQMENGESLDEHSKFLGNTILMASREWFDPVRKKFKFFWNWKFPPNHPLAPFHHGIIRVGSRIFNLHMDSTETTLLSILNILSYGSQAVENNIQMTDKSNFILKLLSLYLSSLNIDPDDRIPELLEVMPKVHHMSVWYSNLINNMKVDPHSMDRTLRDLTELASHVTAKSDPIESCQNTVA